MRNTYTELAANDISALRISVITRKMRFNVQRMPVILVIIFFSFTGCISHLSLLIVLNKLLISFPKCSLLITRVVNCKCHASVISVEKQNV